MVYCVQNQPYCGQWKPPMLHHVMLKANHPGHLADLWCRRLCLMSGWCGTGWLGTALVSLVLNWLTWCSVKGLCAVHIRKVCVLVVDLRKHYIVLAASGH